MRNLNTIARFSSRKNVLIYLLVARFSGYRKSVSYLVVNVLFEVWNGNAWMYLFFLRVYLEMLNCVVREIYRV